MRRKEIQSLNKGITLIALVITIIVLLILAGITISALIGESGIVTKTSDAKEQTQRESAREKIQLSIISSYTADGTFDRTILKEEIRKYGGSILSEEETTIVVEMDGYQEAIDMKTGRFQTLEEHQPILKATYIGTRAFTVEVDTAGKNFSKFSYYVDDAIKEQESNHPTFSLENLQPENTYQVKAILEDENGNIKELNPLTITTQPFTYLYFNGNEFTELSGGWEENIISSNNQLGGGSTATPPVVGNGSYSSGSITKNVDNIFLSTQHSSYNAIGSTTVAIKSKKTIHFSNYKKLYVEGTFYNSYNAGGSIQFFTEDDVLQTGWDISSSLNKDLDLKDIQEAYLNISIHCSYTGGTKGTLTIKCIRLEK